MTQANSPLITSTVGKSSLSALTDAVKRAQVQDAFARVVVIADHPDVARSVRHEVGASGMFNVTLQTGRRLAAELAQPILRPPGAEITEARRPLTRLLEFQAVRQVSEPRVGQLGLKPAGLRRMYGSLASAFREMQERPHADDPTPDGPDDMRLLAESLFTDYLDLVHRRGYYTPAELSRLAAEAVEGHCLPESEIPNVIYYLPRRLSEGDLILARALLGRDRCQVITGLTGDRNADLAVSQLLEQLGYDWVEDTSGTTAVSPLQRRADEAALSIVVAPDPEEEVRTVIRSVVADEAPFHRTAIIYRQDNPYASLLRQELAAAGIPYSGVEYQSLATTPTGLLLLGIADLAASAGSEEVIDRDRLIDWITTTPVRQPPQGGTEYDNAQTVPGSQWANLARDARANGSPQQWKSRLDAHINSLEDHSRERDGEVSPRVTREKRQADALCQFVTTLAKSLHELGNPDNGDWDAAVSRLKDLVNDYHWPVDDESAADRQRIDELIDSLSDLKEWGEQFDAQTLQQVIRESLKSPVSGRGNSVGSGVYLGPPEGIAGADYKVVYAVGMVERQFPPRARANPWLGGSLSRLQGELALERYDFLAAVASTDRAVLCYLTATADRSAAYPSRWLIEAANLLHRKSVTDARLTYENLTENAAEKPWLTFIASREAGLRRLVDSMLEPADGADYNLMHLTALPRNAVSLHPAISSDTRMSKALVARGDRAGNTLSEWDGRVESTTDLVVAAGSRESPISPSALETWATCPYRYFLKYLLGLSAPPDEEDDQISALERGSLVHKILERFVADNGRTEAELLMLADEEFEVAEQRGVTGYPLLWEMEKESIRLSLQRFFEAEGQWVGGAPDLSRAEVHFGQGPETGEISVTLDAVGEIWFRGKIDRIDVLGDEVRVRDFKTGNPEPYYDGSQGRKASRTVANGRALQLPVYLEAAQAMYPDKAAIASYCFPLQVSEIHDVAPYTEDDKGDFHSSLRIILGMVRQGVFPATPEASGDEMGSNCHYCDFKRICPAKRRQFWERKGRRDSLLQPFNELSNRAAIRDDDDAK